jgi:RNA polymerase sigma-70 factor (ECF subfamily)
MNGFASATVLVSEGDVKGKMRQPRGDNERGEEERDAAFARIVGEHARFLYRVANSLLRHPQDAEDAVQDALLKLYRGESWRGMQDERAFLARVVWRTALDRRGARFVGFEKDGAELRIVDGRATPDRAAAENDERALLHELIDGLAEDLRQPLLLSSMDELSSREIGEVMGLPEGTVRTRLMRAREQLKLAFEQRRALAARSQRERGAGDERSDQEYGRVRV